MRSLFTVLFFLIMGVSVHAQDQTVTYKGNDNTELIGVYHPPQGNADKKQGILVLPAWMGITEHERTVADRLAQLGYHVFIADIYGKGNQPKNREEAAKQSGIYKKTIAAYHARIRSALEVLTQRCGDESNIVVIGYCFGGQGALEAARVGMNVKGVVSFHGSYGRDTSRAVQAIKAKVLVLHGADDPYSSKASIDAFQDEMREAGADWQMNYYSNAVHAFTEPKAGNDNSKGAAYNALADKRSWQALMFFLQELFP